jgi:L-malate glycosyltransferase
MEKKITHVLYSGLGGHGNVFFSFLGASHNKYKNTAVFYGVEDLKEEYASQCLSGNIPFQFIRKSRGIDLKFYLDIYNALKKDSPDIIFLHGSSVILPAYIYKFFNNKKILTRETQANHLKSISEWIFMILAMLFSDKIIFLSIAYRKDVQKKLSVFFKKSKTVVIPNGIDLEKYSGNINKNDFIDIGMQSRIVPIKDHETLLKSLTALKNKPYYPKLLLHIAGNGPTLKGLEHLATRLKIEEKVIFYGALDYHDLVRFMKSLDIYVHATWGETMSTSIMQAQACGLPIIASDVPGVNNVIENDVNGLLVKAGNPKDMANAINKLIENPDLITKFEKASSAYAQANLSHRLMFDRYRELIGYL